MDARKCAEWCKGRLRKDAQALEGRRVPKQLGMLTMEHPSAVCKDGNVAKAVTHSQLSHFSAVDFTFKLAATYDEHALTAIPGH